MRYQFVSAAILASISSVFAQTAGFDAISVPTNGQVVKVGDVLDITWAPNAVSGTVTIKLLEGASPSTLNYDPVVVAQSINNLDGQYKWTIPASVGSFATYGIAIILDSDVNTFQWSFPFKIQAGASSSATSVVITTTTAPSSTAAPLTTTEPLPVSSVTSSFTTVPVPSATADACVTGCNDAYNKCRTAASANRAACAAEYSSCLGYLPYDNSGSLVTPTACSSSSAATATPSAPATTPVVTPPATNGTANSTYTAPSGTNTNGTTKTGPSVTEATGAAVANIATGSLALLGGVFAAFMF